MVKKLIEIIHNSLEDSEVSVTRYSVSQRYLQPRREFESLQCYEKKALGKLASDIIKYYNEQKNEQH